MSYRLSLFIIILSIQSHATSICDDLYNIGKWSNEVRANFFERTLQETQTHLTKLENKLLKQDLYNGAGLNLYRQYQDELAILTKSELEETMIRLNKIFKNPNLNYPTQSNLQDIYAAVIEKYHKHIPVYTVEDLVKKNILTARNGVLDSTCNLSGTNLVTLDFRATNDSEYFQIMANRGTDYFTGNGDSFITGLGSRGKPRNYNDKTSHFAQILKDSDIGVVIAVPKETSSKLINAPVERFTNEIHLSQKDLQKAGPVRIFRLKTQEGSYLDISNYADDHGLKLKDWSKK